MYCTWSSYYFIRYAVKSTHVAWSAWKGLSKCYSEAGQFVEVYLIVIA